MDILNQSRLSRFVHVFQTIVVRFQVRSSTVCYGTIKHDFCSINWTVTGFTYGATDFCSSSIQYDLYTILTRLSSLVEWTSCAVVYTVSYGLSLSCTVAHGLSRSCTIAVTIIHGRGSRVSFFKSFKNHTWLSRIHSNDPSLTRIRPRLVRLCLRFTRMANRTSRVFCVRQA